MTYTTNIPQPGDLISISQGQILGNFLALGSSWPVNHVDFNISGSGKHKFVEMPNQTSDPVTAAAEITIYAKAISGIATQFLRKESSGTVIATSGQDPVRGAVGSTFVPGDGTRTTIFKWGDCGTVLTTGKPVSFTTGGGSNFPNNCYQVFLTVYQNGSGTTRTVNVDGGTVTLSGFTAYSTGGGINARYFAIGD